MSRVCYIPVQGIDDVIASKLGTAFNAYRVATLRGMYDSTHSTLLDTSDPMKAALTLAKFRGELKKENHKEMKSVGKNLDSGYRQLRSRFTSEERFNRTNMIAGMFSKILDGVQEANPQISRSMAVRGYTETVKGKKTERLGEFAIFEKVYDQILQLESYFRSKGEVEKADKFRQVIDNWAPLCTLARMKLRDTEGVKLSNKLKLVEEADEGDYGDNDLSQLFSPEETPRDHWTSKDELKSSFGRIGQMTRRFLGSLPVMSVVDKVLDNGKVATEIVERKDDLGYMQLLDPVKSHQAVCEVLRGVTTEYDMLRKLVNKAHLKGVTNLEQLVERVSKMGAKNTAAQIWMIPILDGLIRNPQLRTQFFVDFKNGFQPYSILIEDKSSTRKGYKRWHTKLLNRTEDLLGGAFMSRVLLGKPLNNKTSVFDEKGNVRFFALSKVIADVQKWLYAQQPTGTAFDELKVYNGISKYYTRGGANFSEKRAFLSNTLEALGIDIDMDTLESIMRKSRDIRKLTNALENLVRHGITTDQLKRLDRGETVTYKSMINRKARNSNTEPVFKENIRKINEIITANREGLRLESRVRHKDSRGNNISLSSYVTPSFMSDRFDRIKSYVDANDKEGLRKYLTDNYLCSSYFSRNGEILNQWLKDLLDCCDSKEDLSDTFAAQFYYERALGTADMSFENFTSKQHTIEVLTKYRSDREISPKSDTALFPVFILGDSGVSKYIRARRYDRKTIADGLYNVYRQELERQKLARATNKWLEETGTRETGKKYKSVENFSESTDKFTLLKFLNKDFKADDGTIGKYSSMLSENPTEVEVRRAIEAFMKDAVSAFKVQLSNMGLLETKSSIEKDSKGVDVVVDRYVYLGRDVQPSNLDASLEDFYWNVKFATIQQLQLMTIDPAFYLGTKDLQKRYKEIHAPGRVLDIDAVDKNGQRYSDGIERCAYFDDIAVNAETSNKEFMDVIARIYGKNSDVYDMYTRNTLTDGQGYRTLKSYRKVMGMLGQWSDEMEAAYQAIEQIKSDYAYNADGTRADIPAEKLAEIEKMAVVFQPIKPYMFTHERISVNGSNVSLIPVQHKYAEAVLIPELLPKDSKLREMAYWMEEGDIDLVGSTKIVKVGAFGSTDISKATDAKSLRDALSLAYVHQLDYSHYRVQTNVPEHLNSSQLFGTQVRKLIMAGVEMFSDKYASYVEGNKVNLGGSHGMVNLTGKNLISFYNSLIVANITESFEEFEDIVSDPEVLSDTLMQSIINNSRESMDNIFAFGLSGVGDFAMNLFEGGLEHDTSALILSIFKKLVNKQKIKGGSAVQVSAMGITGYNEDDSLKFVTDGDNILYAECEIPFDISYIDENGNEVALDFDDYCNADGTLKMGSDGKTSLIEQVLPGVLDIVAYRIPTERDYSMLNLKVKRFSRKTAGGTIKVPAQGTTIAGFDFDIDKLYFMLKEFSAVKPEYKYTKQQRYDIYAEIYKNRPDIAQALSSIKDSKETNKALHEYWNDMLQQNPSFAEDPNYNKNKLFIETADKLGIKPQSSSIGIQFEEYDYSKSPLENSRAARNNMLIHLIQQRLIDPETLKQRTTPGGFANSRVSARVMRELQFSSINDISSRGRVDVGKLYRRATDSNIKDPEPDYDPSDPMTIIRYNQQNQVAGKLIGIFANHNTNHAFASLMKTFELKSPIEFAGHSYSDLLKGPDGVDVDLNIAEFLAASVDAVKDPVLNFLNFNEKTADSGALLARLGYTTTEIGMLLNQPIIKEACEYSFNNSVDLDVAIRELRYKYRDMELRGRKKADTDPSHLSVDTLAQNILDNRVSNDKGESIMEREDYTIRQLEVLDLFENISSTAKQVSQFVSSTKFTASNAVGSTFGDLYAQQMKVKQYLEILNTKNSRVYMEVTDLIVNRPIDNDGNLTEMDKYEYMDALIDNPFAYEQAMFDANRKALRAASKYFPYDKTAYVVARETLAGLTKSGILDADTINSIHSDMMVYLLASQELSEFNGDLPKTDTGYGDITTREYYTEYFARDLINFLEINPHMKDLAIFRYMVPTVNEDTDEISINIQNIGGLAPYMKDEIKESWAELSNNPDTARIATDLFMYNFYKLGFNFSPLAFMNLAPIDVKLALQVPRSDGSPRSYKEFMNDIMDDKFNISPRAFAIQYILNHLDNRKFGFEVKSKTARDIIEPLAISSNLVNSKFTLDISNLGEKGTMFLLSSSRTTEGKVMNTFTPIIKLKTNSGEAYFVAEELGSVESPVMGYVKVNKLGSKGKSLKYFGDSGSYTRHEPSPQDSKDLAPEGELTPEDDGVRPDPPQPFDRSAAVNTIVKVYQDICIREYRIDRDGNPAIPEDRLRSIYETFFTDEQLLDVMNIIREAEKLKGLLTLDEEGNITKLC